VPQCPFPHKLMSAKQTSGAVHEKIIVKSETPIEELMSLILKELHINVPVVDYAKKLRDNLILNVGHLKRITPSRLQRLKLPILLEEELEKFISHSRTEFTRPLVQLEEEKPTKNIDSSHVGKTHATLSTVTAAHEPDSTHPSSSRSGSSKLDEIWSLSEKQKKLIKESWNSVITKDEQDPDPSKHGRSLLFEKFYENLFHVSPSSKVLFEEKGVATQARALMHMLAMLVKSIDNPPIKALKTLGAHHLIYGVEVHHYQSFGVALVDTLEAILGKNIITDETREAWLTLMGKIASLMIEGAREAQKVTHKGWVSLYKPPKGMRNARWKKYFATLDHVNFSLYHNNDTTLKPHRVLAISSINEVDIEDGNLIDISTPNCFVLRTDDTDFYFCVDTAEQLQDWVKELKWRIQAMQRSHKYKLVSRTHTSDSETPRSDSSKQSKNNK